MVTKLVFSTHITNYKVRSSENRSCCPSDQNTEQTTLYLCQCWLWAWYILSLAHEFVEDVSVEVLAMYPYGSPRLTTP